MNYYKKDSVLVYQFGKVASTTIVKELNRQGVLCRHLHSLDTMIKYKQIKCSKTSLPIWLLYKNIANAKIKSMLLRFPNKKLKVITLVREPIIRNISMMFQMSHLMLYEYLSGDSRYNVDAFTLWEKMYSDIFNQYYVLDWYEKEFERNLKINVYNYEFNKELGYSIVEKGHIQILILKYERINELSNIIAKFCEIDNFELNRDNSGSEKWYSEIYKTYVNKKKFSSQELSTYYDSKYMKHFYSEKEIIQFTNKYLQ